MLHQVGRHCARRQRVTAALGWRRGTASARKCPSCGTGLPTALPVCPACRYVGRVGETVTHHELLGLSYGANPFVVDAGELKRRFHEAQRLCHPDGWATRSKTDREAALKVSNAVNRAYKTLASPMERIGYLLGREGAGVGEEEQVEDAVLVGEVMEVREAIEASEGEALEQMRADNDGEYKMGRAVGAIEAAVGQADWAGAKASAVRLRYLLTIQDALRRRAENAE